MRTCNRTSIKRKRGSRGFTLIAGLLLMALLSAIAVGLMYTVTGSGHAGTNDLESNVAYYGAESGMEKLTSDVLSMYQQKLSPTQTDLNNLATSSPPSSAQVPGMTFKESAIWANVDKNGNPITGTNVVSSGPYAGLTAEIIPMTLQVSAIRPSGAAVSITRGVEIAMIPVFQFGVFSDSDLSYFAGPPFAFLGRVHTNGNLYLNADSGPLVLGDKVTAVGQILRDRLANNLVASGPSNYYGDVYLATTYHGCDNFAAAVKANAGAAPPASGCANWGKDQDNTYDDSSWGGGIPNSATPGLANGNWSTVSKSTFNSMAVTGVQALQMPFVQGTQVGAANSADQQTAIIRKPQTAAELPTSPLGASREFNKANIRILLGDTEAELYPNGVKPGDGQDIDLTNGGACAATQGLAWAVTGVGTTRFAMATTGLANEPNWKGQPSGTACNPWNLVDGWLRVEYLDKASGNWIGVTKEWLNFGFARDMNPPFTPIDQAVVGAVSGTAGTNKTHPDAILLFQERADRNADKTINATDAPNNVIDGGSNSQYSWYPINFFDAREGFPRDTLPAGFASGNDLCYVNGIMNAVELDTGNLAKWLAGTGPYGAGSGKNVNSGPQNGYLVYFSDRRGMQPNPNATPANVTNGESGLEDVVNSGDPNGTPDAALETNTAGYNNNNGFSPEDVDENKKLDNWGGVNVGNGFSLLNGGISTADKNPYKAIDCMNGGRQNKVTGARHVLRLVDGALGNLPMPGFTVASENPVYVLGDYNSNSADTVWANPPVDTTKNAAAAIIADAVTLLSDSWTDLNDMNNPNNLGGRLAAIDTSYRVAIAAGKNMNFPRVTAANDFGTDGGVHNFLRYIEDWNDAAGNQTTLNYRGSLISMYYAEYATGIFKCCSLVYSPPLRNYSFDSDFLVPTNLPPGTPMLQDIDTLSYWQSFSPCTTQNSSGNCTN
jgi:hypothetical protein